MADRLREDYRKAAGLTIANLLLGLTLVGTHAGEFWPFSIFPMFSQGGKIWVRAVVRDVSSCAGDPQLWHSVKRLKDLPGQACPLAAKRIDQNDISNFISKTRIWSPQRVSGIRSVFENDLAHRKLLILRAEGVLEGDSVSIRFTPVMLMISDSTSFHPAWKTPLNRAIHHDRQAAQESLRPGA